MAKYILFFGLVLMCKICNAQTWDEWFRQKKTQVEYLDEQIIALHVYTDDLQKGYNIIYNGLSAIHDVKNADFNLHKDYFNSLNKVNSALANNKTTAGIIAVQLQILRLNTIINNYLSSGQIASSEITYSKQVMQKVLERCTDNIAELTSLVTDGNLQMKDDERLIRINGIYADITDKFRFTSHFREQIQLLIFSGAKEASNTN